MQICRTLARFVVWAVLLSCAVPALADTGPGGALPDADAASAQPQAETEAPPLSRYCTYTLSRHGRYSRDLYDLRFSTNIRLYPSADILVSFAPDLGAAALFLSFYSVPGAYTVSQYDAGGALLLAQSPSTELLMIYLPLVQGAVSVQVSAPDGFHICECAIYGTGALPSFLHDWEPTPDKLDYLVVSAHPDDDQLFLGAVAPIYGAQRGLTGTTLFMTCNRRERYTEALNGCWTVGIRKMPLFLWLLDGAPDKTDIWRHWDYDDTILRLVRALRQTRPDVVVTHDFQGEYGQPLHIATAIAVTDAVPLAADASYDPESVAQYGVWEVKKVYVHLYGENRITLDMRVPIPALGGRNALEVARLGWQQHKSEFRKQWFNTEDSGRWSAAEYGLYYTAVGYDTGLNDMFEHISGASEAVAAVPAATVAP